MNTSVAAVIPTRNRPLKLSKTLRHVLRQVKSPDYVLVLDNNDDIEINSDIRKEFSSDIRVRHYKTVRNIGGAGAFAAGMQIAIGLNVDFIWLLDDDVYAEENTLSQLVDTFAKLSDTVNLGFVCSLVKWRDGSICELNQPSVTWDWARWYQEQRPFIKIKNCSFASVLIPRSVALKVGLPIAEFFIWYDDIEYTSRISNEFIGLCNMKSIVIHDIELNHGVNFSTIQAKNLWKYKLGARNEVAATKLLGYAKAISKVTEIFLLTMQSDISFYSKIKIAFSALKGLFFRFSTNGPKPTTAIIDVQEISRPEGTQGT